MSIKERPQQLKDLVSGLSIPLRFHDSSSITLNLGLEHPMFKRSHDDFLKLPYNDNSATLIVSPHELFSKFTTQQEIETFLQEIVRVLSAPGQARLYLCSSGKWSKQLQKDIQNALRVLQKNPAITVRIEITIIKPPRGFMRKVQLLIISKYKMTTALSQ
jgi:ubiquinone/menaquinone biosynthesis C-methylase UbiE